MPRSPAMHLSPLRKGKPPTHPHPCPPPPPCLPPAEPMPSADSLSHYPSALNLQSMATGFGGPSATGGSFGGMVDKEATEPPIVQASAIKKLAKKATKGYRKVGLLGVFCKGG